MTEVARFDLKLDAVDKDLLARAASLMGTTMAGLCALLPKKRRISCWSSRLASRCQIAISRLSTQRSRAPSVPIRSCRRR